MEAQSQPEHQTPGSGKKLFTYIPFIFVVVVLTAFTIYLAFRINRLDNQILTYQKITPAPSPKPEIQDYGGSIINARSGKTDNWLDTSNTLVQNRTLHYSFGYPDVLYAVPNVRGQKNSLYFFADKKSYTDYVACINDKTPIEGDLVTRDWEGGCDNTGDLLFSVHTGFLNNSQLTDYKPSELVTYDSTTDEFVWLLPKADKQRSGGLGSSEYTAEGKRKDTTDLIYVNLKYPLKDGVTNKIKNLTGLDMYQLLINILSTFKILK